MIAASNDSSGLQMFRSDHAVTVQVQSVLYNNDVVSIERALESLSRAAELALRDGVCSRIDVRYGDSSSIPCLSELQIAELQDKYPDFLNIGYDFFDANLGSAKGHNRLAYSATTDFLLIQNPDVVICPRLFEHLLGPFSHRGVGMVEAKQLPIEHPKEYNLVTGETSWATTACALIPISLFNSLLGFDADSFFLYCDDVDFSWMVRNAGYKVIYQPSAVVFHDKRLTMEGKWQPTSSEHYYSAEAALILAYKWSRPDIVEKVLADFEAAGNEFHKKAAQEFMRRRANNSLPPPIDDKKKVAQFENGNYATHRYSL